MSKVTIEEILEREGRYLAPTVVDSMEPLLHNRRNTVVIEKVVGTLKKYDVPLYKRPISNKYVLHRIVKVNEKKKEYIIVGDNRWRKEKVPFSWVIGVLVGYFEKDQYISCTSQEYINYSKKIVRNYPFRAIKLIFKGAIRKIKR